MISGMTPEENESFAAEITKHFAAVDPLTQVVLRGHLLLEERLNAILQSSLYNPEMFEKLRLTFHHKEILARSFTVSKRAPGVWELISSINRLRNSIAHSLDAAHRKQNYESMRALYLRELKDPELRKEDENLPEHILFLNAYSFCDGYLRGVEQDAQMVGGGVRRMIDVMRRERYPET